MIQTMSERYRRPDWLRRLNAMAASVGGDARRLIPIDPRQLYEAAIDGFGSASSGDFGDPTWQSRFERLAEALDAASLTVVGRLLTRQELLRSLRTRLLLTAEGDADPAIFERAVAAPVIVTGPARSGTTILFELLALDPDLRAPSAWEALHPVPRPNADAVDARIAASACEQELWADIQPEFAAIHELRSDLPVECVTLTMPCFCGPHWPMMAQTGVIVPDSAQMYDFHRRILQVLQHAAAPRTWLLKTPAHVFTLELLFETYPDAWVVQTHRDPARTMPSTLSTTAMVQWLRTEDVDLAALSAAIEMVFGAGLNHSVELRRSGAVPARFVDVHFQGLMRDPVATLRAAYEAMERAFTAEHAARIERYLAEKPRAKFGTHRYTAEEWGYDANDVRERLAPYIDYFGIALE